MTKFEEAYHFAKFPDMFNIRTDCGEKQEHWPNYVLNIILLGETAKICLKDSDRKFGKHITLILFSVNILPQKYWAIMSNFKNMHIIRNQKKKT